MQGARLILWLFAVVLMSCIDADFARPSRVQTDRVLAVIVDPPVAGTDVSPELRALVVRDNGDALIHEPDQGTEFVWTACLVPESVPGLSGMQYDGDGMQQGCGGTAGLPLVTEADGSARLPSGLLTAIVTDDTLAQVARVLSIPVSLLQSVLQRTGVIMTLQLQVVRDGEPTLLALKRIVLVDRPQAEVTGENPPPPRWSMRVLGTSAEEGRWISGRDGAEPFTCDWEGEPLRVEAGRTYVLDPVNVPNMPSMPDEGEAEPDWRESYEVVDFSGEFTTLREEAYYAWFATDGHLDQEQTTPPADEELWRAPPIPGRYPLWIVVRDGHAGVSACRIEIDVVAR